MSKRAAGDDEDPSTEPDDDDYKPETDDEEDGGDEEGKEDEDDEKTDSGPPVEKPKNRTRSAAVAADEDVITEEEEAVLLAQLEKNLKDARAMPDTIGSVTRVNGSRDVHHSSAKLAAKVQEIWKASDEAAKSLGPKGDELVTDELDNDTPCLSCGLLPEEQCKTKGTLCAISDTRIKVGCCTIDYDQAFFGVRPDGNGQKIGVPPSRRTLALEIKTSRLRTMINTLWTGMMLKCVFQTDDKSRKDLAGRQATKCRFVYDKLRAALAKLESDTSSGAGRDARGVLEEWNVQTEGKSSVRLAKVVQSITSVLADASYVPPRDSDDPVFLAVYLANTYWQHRVTCAWSEQKQSFPAPGEELFTDDEAKRATPLDGLPATTRSVLGLFSSLRALVRATATAIQGADAASALVPRAAAAAGGNLIHVRAFSVPAAALEAIKTWNVQKGLARDASPTVSHPMAYVNARISASLSLKHRSMLRRATGEGSVEFPEMQPSSTWLWKRLCLVSGGSAAAIYSAFEVWRFCTPEDRRTIDDEKNELDELVFNHPEEAAAVRLEDKSEKTLSILGDRDDKEELKAEQAAFSELMGPSAGRKRKDIPGGEEKATAGKRTRKKKLEQTETEREMTSAEVKTRLKELLVPENVRRLNRARKLRTDLLGKTVAEVLAIAKEFDKSLDRATETALGDLAAMGRLFDRLAEKDLSSSIVVGGSEDAPKLRKETIQGLERFNKWIQAGDLDDEKGNRPSKIAFHTTADLEDAFERQELRNFDYIRSDIRHVLDFPTAVSGIKNLKTRMGIRRPEDIPAAVRQAIMSGSEYTGLDIRQRVIMYLDKVFGIEKYLDRYGVLTDVPKEVSVAVESMLTPAVQALVREQTTKDYIVRDDTVIASDEIVFPDIVAMQPQARHAELLKHFGSGGTIDWAYSARALLFRDVHECKQALSCWQQVDRFFQYVKTQKYSMEYIARTYHELAKLRLGDAMNSVADRIFIAVSGSDRSTVIVPYANLSSTTAVNVRQFKRGDAVGKLLKKAISDLSTGSVPDLSIWHKDASLIPKQLLIQLHESYQMLIVWQKSEDEVVFSELVSSENGVLRRAATLVFSELWEKNRLQYQDCYTSIVDALPIVSVTTSAERAARPEADLRDFFVSETGIASPSSLIVLPEGNRWVIVDSRFGFPDQPSQFESQSKNVLEEARFRFLACLYDLTKKWTVLKTLTKHTAEIDGIIKDMARSFLV